MEPKPTPSLYGGDGVRGAGGKFRKPPPARKAPSTPYDRPHSTQSSNKPANRNNSGWLSRIVDPAYRLITGGATKIFPSFFGSHSNAPAISAPTLPAPIPDGQDAEVEPCTMDQEMCSSSYIAKSTAGIAPSNTDDVLKTDPEKLKIAEDKLKNVGVDTEISRIEELMKGKTFSREEINRLTEILNSKVVDLSDSEQEKKATSMSKKREIGGLSLMHDDVRKALTGQSTPLPHASQARDEIGASPIDIARAYMDSRALERSQGPYSVLTKGEMALEPSKEFASETLAQSSPWWPGAMVQDQRGYATPQSQKHKYGLYDFPRTPYSRTIYSKSRTQLQPASGRVNTISSPFQQSRGQVNLRNDMRDDGYGSAGPIRRIRNKFASETRPRGSIFQSSFKDAYRTIGNHNLKGHLPTADKTVEPGETSGTLKYQDRDNMVGSSGEGKFIQNTSSSEAVKKILEHLDRNKPTPKEKAEEMKLATTWKKQPPEAPVAMQNDKTAEPRSGESGLQMKTGFFDLKFSAKGNADNGMLKLPIEAQNRSFNVVGDSANTSTGKSTVAVDGSGFKNNFSMGPSFGLQSTLSSQGKRSHENDFGGTNNGQGETSQPPAFRNQTNGHDVTIGNASVEQSKTKRNLPSIFVNKPSQRFAVSSENGMGFTFPVSASSGALSEPPTPSILPSSSASALSQPKEVSSVPSYSFGNKSNAKRLAFTFPSSSNASSNVDASDIKFSFGSDKKNRLSFSSVGKDAICY